MGHIKIVFEGKTYESKDSTYSCTGCAFDGVDCSEEILDCLPDANGGKYIIWKEVDKIEE